MKINYDDFVHTPCGVCKEEIEIFEKYEEVNSLMVCEECYNLLFGSE